MSRSGTRVGLVQLIPLTLLFCLIPFFVYYLFYYQSSYSYMVDRNMRSVARVAKLTEERLSNFYRVIENSVGTAQEESEGCVRELELHNSTKAALSHVPDLEFVSLVYEEPSDCMNDESDAELNNQSIVQSKTPERAELKKSINPSKAILKQDQDGLSTSANNSRDRQSQNLKSNKNVSIVSIHESKGTKLRLTYSGRPQVSKLIFFNPVTIKADLFLSDLVGDLDRDGLFDEVAILDDQKDVLLQTDPHGPRLAQFLSAAFAEIPSDDKPTESRPTPEGESATKMLTLGNEAYRVFWQPIQLELKKKSNHQDSPKKSISDGESFTYQNDSEVFWVYGIAKESRLKREALRIEVIPLLVLVFILLIAAVAWPLLKVVLLGTRDRLSGFDIHLIKLAVVSGVAIIAIFVLGAYHYYNLLAKVDKALIVLSEEVKGNLRRELKSAVRQLEDASEWDELDCGSDSWTFEERCRHKCQCTRLLDLSKRYAAHSTGTDRMLSYEGIGMLITSNEDGNQSAKWTIKNGNTPTIKIADREYHQKIKKQAYDFDCSSGSKNDWCDDNMRSYVVSPVRSNNTGEKHTMVLIKHPKSDSASYRTNSDPLSIQLTTRLESLWDAVLPLGFGFAIVDSAGFVLYHSEPRFSLDENLFHEITDPNKLQAAIANNQHSIMTVHYHGERHRALGMKLSASPWSLVVFSKTIYFETAILESTLSSLVYFLFILAIMSLLRIMHMMKAGRAPSRWLWYATDKLRLYNRAIIAFGMLGLPSFVLFLLLIVYNVLSSSWVFALSLYWSMLTIYVAWRILGRHGIEQPNQHTLQSYSNVTSLGEADSKGKNALWMRLFQTCQQWDPRKKYLTVLMLFLVFIGILPTTAFFISWYSAHCQALHHHVARDLENQKSNRRLRLNQLYQNVSSADEDFLERRNEKLIIGEKQAKDYDRKYYPAVYWYSPLADLNASKIDDSQRVSGKLDRLVASLFLTLPAHNEFALRLRETIKQGVRETLRDPFSKISEDKIRSIPIALRTLTIILCAFVAVLSFFLVYFVVRYVAEKIFGLGVALLATDCAADVDSNIFYKLQLNLTKQELEELINRKKGDANNNVFELDMRRMDAVDRIVEARGSTHVILHHFESLLVRSDARLGVLPKILDLLEELILIKPSIEVIVCSQIDPVYYLNERKQDDGINGSQRDKNKAQTRNKVESEKDSQFPSREELRSDDIIRCAEVFSQFIRIQHRIVARKNEGVEGKEICVTQTTDSNGDRPTTTHSESHVDPPRSELKNSDRPMGDENSVKDFVESELDWDDELRSLKGSIIATSTIRDGKKLTVEEILQKIAYCAAPRYRFLWTLCTNTEKIVLLDLASEGTINPKNWNVVTELVARGLVRWHYGTYFLACHTFERFILQAMRPDDAVKLRQVTPSAWSWISVPLLVLLIASFAFFFWSQPKFAESMLAVLGAGTAGLAGLVKLLSIIKYTPNQYEK